MAQSQLDEVNAELNNRVESIRAKLNALRGLLQSMGLKGL